MSKCISVLQGVLTQEPKQVTVKEDGSKLIAVMEQKAVKIKEEDHG